jgi:hypothetical protein
MREHPNTSGATPRGLRRERVRRLGSPFHRDEEGQSHAGPEPLSAVHKPTVTPLVRAAIVETCSINR